MNKLLHVELVNRVGQLDEFTTEPLKRSPTAKCFHFYIFNRKLIIVSIFLNTR